MKHSRTLGITTEYCNIDDNRSNNNTRSKNNIMDINETVDTITT